MFCRGGIRSWVFRYRDKAGVRCKLTIARYPDMSLRAAREERDKLAAEVARGLSPAHDLKEQKEREEGRGSDPTLAQFAERWYRELILPPRAKTIAATPSQSAAPWTIRFFPRPATKR